jgi:hypothetical protein
MALFDHTAERHAKGPALALTGDPADAVHSPSRPGSRAAAQISPACRTGSRSAACRCPVFAVIWTVFNTFRPGFAVHPLWFDRKHVFSLQGLPPGLSPHRARSARGLRSCNLKAHSPPDNGEGAVVVCPWCVPVRSRPAGLTRQSSRCCYPAETPESRDHLPWQNCRVAGEPDDGLVEAIALELATCRQRGIERLDVSSHNQIAVQIPLIQHLASEYVMARQLHAHGRIQQLKFLFRDAIEALAVENEGDALLVGDLFFGDSRNRVTKSAGELLDLARRKSGYRTEALFRHARRTAFVEFAQFLPDFVEDTKRGNERSASSGAVASGSVSVLPELTTPAYNEGAPDPEVQRHEATTGYVVNGEHFTRLLAEAANATIVGFTNEKLASMLRTALDRKRAALQRPDACWDSLRIVFLSAKLLDLVNDERREYPSQEEALEKRREAASYGRRTVSAFLRRLPVGRWATYESNYLPPLVGTLFEMPNGRRIVQLLIRRPQRAAEDHLYLQIEDTQGHYFSAAFEEIVHSSADDNKVVPVGSPATGRFRVTSTRYRQNVLKDGSHATGWLPLVLVITWRTRGGRAEPLLQLRTQLNAARELDRLSHLSGHILEDDRARLPDFGLEDAVPLRAARRRVQMETSEEDSGILRPVGTNRYIHPDKENLFFFMYSCEFPEGFQPSGQAEMFPVSVPELLSIRENQALRLASELCESPPARGKARTDAFEIASLNLTLHGYPELARRMMNAESRGPAGIAKVAPETRDLEERTRQTWSGLEQNEVVLMGLSGLQYREFFSFLLPYYESVGVAEAADHLRIIREDENARQAIARLAELYHDESIMESIQLEL